MSTSTRAPEPPPSGAALLDLEALLGPLPGADPAGESLRYEGTYDAIRAAREEDDSSLPQGVWEHPPRRAEWRRVVRIATEALEQRSKDLQIAAWLVEACLALEGVVALPAGLALLSGLCERYWETLHPGMQEGDAEYRGAVLEWVGQRFAEVLRMDALSDAVESLERPLNLADWEQVRWIAQHPGAVPAQQAVPATPTAFLALTGATPTAFYHRRHEALGHARESLRELEIFVDGHFPVRDTPSLRPLRECLEALSALVARILEARGETPGAGTGAGEPAPAGAGECPVAPSDATPAMPAPSRAGEAIASRAEAYRRLREAAEYLRRTEPHSPTPYLVLRAVAWADRSLLEVLEELLPDARSLDHLRAALGLDGGEEPPAPR